MTIGALIIVIALMPAAARGAEQAEVDVTSPPADEVAEVLSQIRSSDAELVDLAGRLPAAEGEELDVLRNRVSELAGTQVDDLVTLLSRVEARRLASSDAPPLEPHLEELAGSTSRHLRTHVDRLAQYLGERSEERAGIEADAAEEFEHRMAIDTSRLDSLYMSLIKLTSGMEAAGYPTQEERDFLEARLTERGERLVAILSLASSQLTEIRERVGKAPDDPALQAQLFAREERYDSNKSALLATIHMLRLLDLDYVDLEIRAIELTGVVTPEGLGLDVAEGLLAREVGRIRAYLAENGPQLAVGALVILVLLTATWLVARIVRALTGRILDRRELAVSRLLRDTAVAMSGRIVLFFGLILVLSQLGFDLGPILAGLGIAGLVVGFALQDSLSNFAAGVMILVYRPFDVGDVVETAGILGKVSDMNLVSVRILSPDNQALVVPNRTVWGDVIRNLTAEELRRVDLVFGISYEDDVPTAERILGEIVAEQEKVLGDPAPVIKLHALGDSSVDFVVRPWVRTDDYWDVYWDITRAVKTRFDDEGISIPYPQTDVHLVAEPGPAAGDLHAMKGASGTGSEEQEGR